ncbi:hypothetical protein SAMN04488072_101309 [Lentibacillus halodurans]|uniref:ABC transporter periplasmic binding protein yphF n=1 Tax=Lentibacillus halodurans TaxID=237679 RepID=A0A1I0VC39_9BACI|nr:hypothetical protein [Lentibacillus halodurans]SFA73617.1 hypothetical protein SAMN04488072_101309 [Lentibacillus halodurans]
MKHTYIRLLCLLSMIFLLSGCLYPESELSKNQKSNESQLEAVQSAVDQYQEKNQGLLPIQTKPSDTPIFQKHLVDFQPLKEQNIMTEIPGNAYQNGGIYQYTIIIPDENPQVKLIDLRISDTIREVAVKLDIYRNEHLYPPFGKEVAEGIFQVDHEELGLESRPYVVSPYSQENLPIVMDTEGNLYVDYRIDLTNALEEYEHNFEEGDDIRYLLAEKTPFVPVYSFPYTIRDGEPAFNLTDKQNK